MKLTKQQETGRDHEYALFDAYETMPSACNKQAIIEYMCTLYPKGSLNHCYMRIGNTAIYIYI